MDKKSWIGIGLVSICVVALFLGYELNRQGFFKFEEVLDEDLQVWEQPPLKIGGINEVIEILEGITECYDQYDESIEVQLTEDEPQKLIQGLQNETYDLVITSEKIDEDEFNSGAYQELLFGVIADSEEDYLDRLLYCYVLTEKYQESSVKDYLKLFYSEPLSFLNTEDVYALQSTIYDETLTYLELLELYPN